ALPGLADGCERLEEHVLERLAVLVALPELGRLAAELVVGELLELGLERRDVLGLVPQRLEPASFARAEDLLEGPVILRPRLQGTALPGARLHAFPVTRPCLASYTPRVQPCPRCGKENPDGFQFCGFCTAPLTEAQPVREQRKVVTVLFCDVT